MSICSSNRYLNRIASCMRSSLIHWKIDMPIYFVVKLSYVGLAVWTCSPGALYARVFLKNTYRQLPTLYSRLQNRLSLNLSQSANSVCWCIPYVLMATKIRCRELGRIQTTMQIFNHRQFTDGCFRALTKKLNMIDMYNWKALKRFNFTVFPWHFANETYARQDIYYIIPPRKQLKHN
jgi:hypothetical protein